ncbi:MAG: SUMF1/EgtB/PvdO family nonheme iron enzyme [bacterium]
MKCLHSNGLERRGGLRIAPAFVLFLTGCSLLFVGFAPVFAQSPYPTPPPLLVITDLKTQSETSVAEAGAFSEFIRREVTRSGLYRVIDKASMMAILKAQQFPLPRFEVEDFAAMGRVLGADQVLAGNVDRVGPKIELTIRIIDCASIEFLVDLHKVKSPCTPQDLIGDWGRSVISELFSIPLERLSTPTPFGSTRIVATPTPSIPDAILNKYPGMIYIPAGKFVFGSDRGDECESPQQTVSLPAYYIDETEVTNWEYKRFVDETNYRKPVHWEGGAIPPGLEDHPVVWVSWEDAKAYAEWNGARLPTEMEWEKAARGTNGWVYPWADRFDPKRANTWEAGIHGTSPVGLFPDGKSPYGLLDMAGNVSEWVADAFKPYPGGKTTLPAYSRDLRVLRGGSWTFNDFYARSSHRYPRAPNERHSSYGFRTARDADSVEPWE